MSCRLLSLFVVLPLVVRERFVLASAGLSLAATDAHVCVDGRHRDDVKLWSEGADRLLQLGVLVLKALLQVVPDALDDVVPTRDSPSLLLYRLFRLAISSIIFAIMLLPPNRSGETDMRQIENGGSTSCVDCTVIDGSSTCSSCDPVAPSPACAARSALVRVRSNCWPHAPLRSASSCAL
jgi:hypothetical protein